MKAQLVQGIRLFGFGRDEIYSLGQRPSQRRRKITGFTLVELLVVITIIALLMGILLPALGKVRRQGRKIACLSNIRQIGIALQAYLTDNEYRLPPSSCNLSDPNEYWLRILAKYTRQGLLLRCPEDKGDDFVDWGGSLGPDIDDLRWSSFALNSLLDPDCAFNGGKYNNVMNIRKPEYCIYVSESPSSWKNYDHLHPEGWGSLAEAKGQVAWDRHDGTSNYLFVDGHAENLKIEQTWSWPGECYWYPGYAPGWPPDD